MKAMAIRVIETKEPAMVLFGHYSDWNEKILFWRIDECVAPNACEYLEFDFEFQDFGLLWPSAVPKDERGDFDLTYNVYFSGEFEILLLEAFKNKSGWQEINIETNDWVK